MISNQFEEANTGDLQHIVPNLNRQVSNYYEIALKLEQNTFSMLLEKLSPHISEEQFSRICQSFGDKATPLHLQFPIIIEHLSNKQLEIFLQFVPQDQFLETLLVIDLIFSIRPSENFGKEFGQKLSEVSGDYSDLIEIFLKPFEITERRKQEIVERHLKDVTHEQMKDWFGDEVIMLLFAIVPYVSEYTQQKIFSKLMNQIQILMNREANKEDDSVLLELTMFASLAPEPFKSEILQYVLEYLNYFSNDEFVAIILCVVMLSTTKQPEESLLRRALKAISKIQEQNFRDLFLSTLIYKLPSSLLKDALEASQSISDEPGQTYIYVHLATHLKGYAKEKILQTALDLAKTIQDVSDRVYTLKYLSSQVPEPRNASILQDALQITKSISDDETRLTIFSELMEHVPELAEAEALGETFLAATNIREEWKRFNVIKKLVPYLPDVLLKDLMLMVHSLDNRSVYRDSLVHFLPHLSDNLRTDAFCVVQDIDDKERRLFLVSAFIKELSADQINELIDFVDSYDNDHYRQIILIDMIPHLPEELLRKALQVSQSLQNKGYFKALETLGSHLQKELLSDAFNFTLSTSSEQFKSKGLGILSSYLPPEMLIPAIDAARNIQDPYYSAQALSAFAKCTGHPLNIESLQLALDRVTLVQDEISRAELLSNIAPMWLAYELPQKSIIEYFSEIQNSLVWTRMKKPAEFINCITNETDSYRYWRQILKNLSKNSRSDFLQAFIYLADLGLFFATDEEQETIEIANIL